MHLPRSPRRAALGLALVLTAVSAAVAATPSGAAAPGLTLRVLSSRADLVSAGDALVEVGVPSGVDVRRLTVTDDGRDVSRAFARRADGRVL
ncbi:MAG: hypothetical protein JWO60_1545, partial [Frankiales bacterium]|nr:hypothetical protein [Frankiales bacterium]